MNDNIEYCYGCGEQITLEFAAINNCTCVKDKKEEVKSFEDCMDDQIWFED